MDIRSNPQYEAGYFAGLYGDKNRNTEAWLAGYNAGLEVVAHFKDFGVEIGGVFDYIAAMERIEEIIGTEEFMNAVTDEIRSRKSE